MSDKKSAKRQKFLDAARRIFSDKGFQATNVTDIVSEVKSGQGTFYYHFKDKQAIFDELMLEFLGRLAQVVADNDIRDAGRLALSHREPAIDNARRIAGVFFDNIDTARLFFRESRYVGGEAMERINQYYELLYAQIEDGIRQGLQEGSVRTGTDPFIASRCYVGATEKVIYEILRTGRPVDINKIAEQIVDFQSIGILTRSAGDNRPAGDNTQE